MVLGKEKFSQMVLGVYFWKITRMAPALFKFGNFGPYAFKNGKVHSWTLNYGNVTEMNLEASLENLQTQSLEFQIVTSMVLVFC